MLELTVSDGVGWLRLCRGERRNAQTPELWARLRAVGDELVAGEEVRVLVVAGEGPSFSAGLDTGLITSGALFDIEEDVSVLQSSFRWLRDAPFVTIAAVHGHALGAGLELALACDIRVFAASAVVGLPEVEFGIIPDLGGTTWLPELVGYARAIELVTTGRRLGAREAHQWGLANSVVAEDEMHTAVTALATRIAAKAPLAVLSAKRALQAALVPPDRSFERAADGMVRCVAALAGTA